jgi:hypothetical protein
VHQRFAARTHQNPLCNSQIPPDAKTQVLRNLSRRAFCGIRTGPTRELKIVRERFTTRVHRTVLRDPQIPPDAKTQVRRNMSRHGFCGIRIGLTDA